MFQITVKALSGDRFQYTSLCWTVTVPQGVTNPGTVTAFTATMTPLTVALLCAKLKQMGQLTFTPSFVAQADYTVALLNYTPTNNYISFKLNTPTTSPFTLQVHGYDNINIYSAIVKSVHASNSGLKTKISHQH